jgi:aminopeptidase N
MTFPSISELSIGGNIKIIKKLFLPFLFLIFIFFHVNVLYGLNLPAIISIEEKEPPDNKLHIINHSKIFEKSKDDYILSVKQRPYDVLSYNINLDWNGMLSATGTGGDSRRWSARNDLKLKLTADNITAIELDAAELRIDSVFINSIILSPPPQPDNTILTIQLGKTGNNNDTFNISMYYTYVKPTDKGFYINPKGAAYAIVFGDTVKVEERTAYTATEPEDARYWLPCNDRPNDKSRVSISVTIPPNYSAASNGNLDSIEKFDDHQVWHWSDTTQISTYLISVCASIYSTYSDWYHKISNPDDSVEIKYYIWKKDLNDTVTDGTRYNARNAFKRVVEMMQYYSGKFIEYPFVKYGMVVVFPYVFGGMENQTMTMINRSWLRGKTESGIAHELSHQWLGDLITCSCWDDVWINEGGATFCEFLWSEHNGGLDSYNNNVLSARSNYLNHGGITQPAVFGIPTDPSLLFSTYSSLVYSKGGIVYNMLRMQLGDEQFFNILRSMLRYYSFQSITTEQFRDYFGSHVTNSPVSMSDFFDQWMFKAGHPVYTIESIVHKYDSLNYHVNLVLTQTQTGSKITSVFQTPLKIIFYKGDEPVIDSVMNNQRQQQYEFDLPFKPDSVKLDLVLSLLEVKSNVLNTVEDYGTPKNNLISSVYPNPMSKGVDGNFDFYMPFGHEINIEIIDADGNFMKDIFTGLLQQGNYTMNFKSDGLSSGAYFLRLQLGDVMLIKSFVVLR